MSGFFGVIQTDRREWQAMRLHPRTVEAALLIRRCRSFMAPDQGLAEISEMVVLPLNADSQMIAATALALLLNAPFFYVEGTSNGGDCSVKTLDVATPAEAHRSFEDYCAERFPVSG